MRYLSGAYVASSYPLSPVVLKETQQSHESNERTSLTSFGENMMFTYYNAVAAQLDKPGAGLLRLPERRYNKSDTNARFVRVVVTGRTGAGRRPQSRTAYLQTTRPKIARLVA